MNAISKLETTTKMFVGDEEVATVVKTLISSTATYRKISAGLIGGVALMAVSGMEVRAAEVNVAGGVVAECPATGPGIVVCGTAGVILHELVQMANGKQGFGPNGEIMKVLAVPVKIVDGNIKAATGESGEIAKALRGTTGISIRDIDRHGIFGGPNSIFRKPFG